jgi:hypothetical protein
VLNSIVVGSDTIRGLGNVLNNGLWCRCSGRKTSGFLSAISTTSIGDIMLNLFIKPSKIFSVVYILEYLISMLY